MKSMKQGIATLAAMMVMGTFALAQDVADATDTTTTTSGVSAFQGPWGQGSRLGEAERIQSLATEYGVSTTDIQAYLDQGYRLGDIDMALSIATQSGKALTDVIALGKAGDPESWISAGSSLGVTVSPPGKPEGVGKGPHGPGSSALEGEGKGHRGPPPEASAAAASNTTTVAGVSAKTGGGKQSGQGSTGQSMGGGQGKPTAGGKH